jgi:serine protease Do
MRYLYLRPLMSAALLAAICCGAPAGAKAQHSRRSPIVEAVQKTRGSIVTIRVCQRYAGRSTITGTGVIVDERGFVVTNRHVVGSSSQVMVQLADGTDLPARVLLRDSSCDLAVLRVRAGRKLPALALAPVSDLMVGETVIAIGHPYGYVNTVSTGIISALNREITMPSGEVLTGLIQTDASINPGNSGGPLLNINGELIGINAALREGAQGIAFAINAGTVRQMLSRHLSAQNVAGVSHGLACAEKVLGETGDRQRVVVADVAEETPAAAAGVQKGDEILAVAARPVANRFDVERALWEKHPGEKVALKVRRQGKELTVTLTLSPAAEATQLTHLFEGPSNAAQSDQDRGNVAVAHRP